MNKICPFCKEKPSTKTNSHIISNFLTTTLKESKKGHRVYSISKYDPAGKYPFTQDSPKEDYLFCPECESAFNLRYERHIANTFYLAYCKKNNFFDVYLKSSDVRYRVYTNTDYIIFKKFLLLQLYRMHVSQLVVFAQINLSEEQLILVHRNLYDLSYFEDIKVTLFSTDLVVDKPNGIFAKPMNEQTYFTLMNDLLCVFEFDNTKSIFRQTDEASNYKNNSPRLIFLGPKQTEVLANTIARLVANQ